MQRKLYGFFIKLATMWSCRKAYLCGYNLLIKANTSFQTGAGSRAVLTWCCWALLPQLVFNRVSASGSPSIMQLICNFNTKEY